MSRWTTAEDHFDLLPLIAILMCVLGVLLLVTISMATISTGVGAAEGWIPESHQGQGSRKTPVLVEWDGDVATFHLDGQRQEVPVRFPKVVMIRVGDRVLPVFEKTTSDDAANAQFKRVVDALAERKTTHYALVAVRPSGFSEFRRLLQHFRDRRIDVGYEPVATGKVVRLVKEAAHEDRSSAPAVP